jgi:hypothetical protein
MASEKNKKKKVVWKMRSCEVCALVSLANKMRVNCRAHDTIACNDVGID